MSGLQDGVKITIKKCETANSEADWIAAEIEKMIGGVRHFSIDSGISDGGEYLDITGFHNFAVLCRTTEQFESLKKAFNNHGIPGIVYGEKPFYTLEPFSGILNSIKKNFESNSINNTTISEYISRAFEDANCLTTDEHHQNSILLTNAAEKFGMDYISFFNSLILNAGIDFYDKNSAAVSLITLHSSKGLEFDVVFIAGCDNKIIPFEIFEKKNTQEVKEEERLFYVAMTRAKKHLFLTYALKRFWKKRFFETGKSSILDRIEKKLLSFAKDRQFKNITLQNPQLALPF